MLAFCFQPMPPMNLYSQPGMTYLEGGACAEGGTGRPWTRASAASARDFLSRGAASAQFPERDAVNQSLAAASARPPIHANPLWRANSEQIASATSFWLGSGKPELTKAAKRAPDAVKWSFW
jgi:hypothetical protein